MGPPEPTAPPRQVPSGGSAVADRLRAGLRRAGIRASDADVERALGEGGLERLDEYAQQLALADGDAEPDYLSDWATERLEPEGRAAPTTSRASSDAAAPSDGDMPSTIGALATLVRKRSVSPVELAERALRVIEERDGELNAFQLVMRRRALEVARRAEADIGKGAYRGPLHGIPVAVKDLFDMRDTATTAGSTILAGEVSSADSAVVARLEDAGAVIVGKTRLPEFAFWPGSSNPHYGPTRNPLDPNRDAGGSSSGSAVAVAAGMACGAIGSDTGGSVRIPAALCGIVGLKPTFGRVDLTGCVPLAWSLDHAGPLAGTVDDAELLLEALAPSYGPGGRGPAGTQAGDGLRVAVLTDDGSSRPLAGDEALEAWRASCEALAGEGAEITEVSLPEMSALRATNLLIMSVEASTFHAPMLRSHYDAYGEQCRVRLLVGFAFGGTELVQAQRFRRMVRRRWTDVLAGADVLSTPCQPGVAPPLGEPGSTRLYRSVQRSGLAGRQRAVRRRRGRASPGHAARGEGVAGRPGPERGSRPRGRPWGGQRARRDRVPCLRRWCSPRVTSCWRGAAGSSDGRSGPSRAASERAARARPTPA